MTPSKNVMMLIRIDRDLKRQFQKMCLDRDMKMTEALNRVIEDLVNSHTYSFKTGLVSESKYKTKPTSPYS